MCIKNYQNAQMYNQAKVTISSTLELLLKFAECFDFSVWWPNQSNGTDGHVCLYCNTEG